jgi:two-component system, OmpR family, sensor kinase
VSSDIPVQKTAAGASRMRLSVLLSFFATLLLVGALASAALTYWVVYTSRAIEERIELAQASYAEHQALQANMYRLFKEEADALLIGNRDHSVLEMEIKAEISANLEEIRRIIALEIEVDREEETEELGKLALLERTIYNVLERYRSVMHTHDESESTAQGDLANLLDSQIDRDLSDQIDAALDGEREEVAMTTAEAMRFRGLAKQLAAVVLVFLMVTTLTAAVLFGKTVVVPLRSLIRRADAYRLGVYDGPIPTSGAAELHDLTTTLSDMAAEIDARERALREHARKLETRVAERTFELQTLLSNLEQIAASRRQMLADVSHELRTPLTIIQGEADIALRTGIAGAENCSDSFLRIRDAARHTNQIVEDLLLIAREEAGQLRLDLHTVDLEAALVEAADLVQSKIEILRLGLPTLARVDPVRVRQCLLAVMNNASRYGGQNVRAWVARSAEGFEIVIEDDGPGMSATEKEQAFQRFFRGSGAQGTGVEGTGLGLPIVSSIMNAHGGKVELADRDGGGLIVRLQFVSSARVVPLRDERKDFRRKSE